MDTSKTVTMRLQDSVISVIEENAKRLKISKTKFVESLLLGLNTEQIDEACEKGKVLCDTMRLDALNKRRAVKERLKNLSTEQLEKLLNDGAA